MPTPTTVQARFQVRADTAANWTAANPTLLLNEIGIENDTKKLKLGDGTTAWASLAYFPSIVTGGTVLGNLEIGTTGTLTFEGSTADGFETTLAVTDPTADRTITLPNITGTVVTTGDTGTVTSTMIADGTIVDADISATAEIAVSKLVDGTARQLLQTDAAGTGVEWASNIDIPGTLDVTNAATFDSSVAVTGALTKSGSNVVTVGDTGTVTSTMIADGTIVNADVNASAAIAGTKISPDFGSQNVTTTGTVTGGTVTGNSLSPLSSTVPSNGIYLPAANTVGIATNTVSRVTIDGSGTVAVTNNLNIDNGTLFVDAANNRVGVNTNFTAGPAADLVIRNANTNLTITTSDSLGSNSLTFNHEVAGTSNRILSGGGNGQDSLTVEAVANVDILTNEIRRLKVSTSEIVLNDDGNIYNFRVEGDTKANLLFVNGTTDRIGIDDASPDALLTVNGVASFGAGAAATPSIAARGDLNTGVYFPGADQVAISTNSVERLKIGTSEVVFNDAGNNIDFRVEGDTNANLLFVDASTDRVGIGTASPSGLLHVKATGAATAIVEGGGTSGDTILHLKGNANDFQFRVGNSASPYGIGLYDVTNAAFRYFVDSSGRLLVGTTTATANGGVLQVSNGITFPATQSACSDANTLDDYEEGTWTPVVTGWTSITYAQQHGNYIKIGRQVTAWFYVRFTGTSAAAAVEVSGLPFTAATFFNGGALTYYDVALNETTGVLAFPTSTKVVLYADNDTAATISSNGNVTNKFLVGFVTYGV